MKCNCEMQNANKLVFKNVYTEMILLSLIFVSAFSGTCKEYGCGGYNPNQDCQCNSACTSHGDCCSDYKDTCEKNASCAKYGCGSFDKTHQCQCNAECKQHNDCCSDYDTKCGGGGGGTVGCPKAPTSPGDRRTNKDTLKVVAWNVDWLFTNVSHDMGKIVCPGPGSESCDWKNESIALAHLEKVIENIATLNGDIVAMEEVEDCDTLRNISTYLGYLNYKAYMHLGQDKFTGQNPGILTRVDPFEDLEFSTEEVPYPVAGSTCPQPKSGTHGASKHYHARFGMKQFNISMIGVHLLAGPTDNQRCLEREAQATVVANIVKKAVSMGDEIIVLGDFNDWDDSVLDINSNKPISSTLRILREAGNLTNVASKIADQSQRYSDWYNEDGSCEDRPKDRSMIDHMLVSDELFARITDVGILHNFVNGCGSLYSDHWPVYASFDLS